MDKTEADFTVVSSTNKNTGENNNENTCENNNVKSVKENIQEKTVYNILQNPQETNFDNNKEANLKNDSTNSLISCPSNNDLTNEQEAEHNNTSVMDALLGEIPYEVFEKDVQDYELPEMKASVLVDRSGYKKGEDKIAFFIGDNLSEEFRVMDAATDEEVYVGNINNKIFSEEYNDYISYGNFSEFDKEGSYYIVTDRIGESYSFCISDSVYDDMLTELAKSFNNLHSDTDNSNKFENLSGGWLTDENEKSVIEASKTVINLIIAEELQADLINNLSISDDYADADLNTNTNENSLEEYGEVPDIIAELNYECLWLSKMQDETMAVSEGVFDGALENNSLESSAYFCSALALFADIYSEYDNNASEKYLYQAIGAYDYIKSYRNNMPDNLSDELWFMANSALYRATGSNDYKNEIEKYYESANFEGTYFLLSTPKIPNQDICFKLMDRQLEQAENIAKACEEDAFYINDKESLLEDMKCIAFANYIITNYEYRKILQNAIHYLYGRNINSELFSMSRPYEKSILMILLSNVDYYQYN